MKDDIETLRRIVGFPEHRDEAIAALERLDKYYNQTLSRYDGLILEKKSLQREYVTCANERNSLRALLERATRKALDMAWQKLSSELTNEERERADFIGGYDLMVNRARAVLSELSADAPEQQAQISDEAVKLAWDAFSSVTAQRATSLLCTDDPMRAAITAAIEWGKGK